MHIAAKIGIGVAVAGGLALVLSACGAKEEDPQSRVLDEFGKFDRNNDNKWTANEAKRFEVGRPYTTNHHETRIGDFVHWSRDIVHKEHTHSMQKAFSAARGNDAIASLQELTKLAAGFDVDKNGTLNRKEQKAFNNAYETQTQSRTILDRRENGVRYDPYPEPNPYPYPGNGSGNGPGDSGGYPGSGGSGNGPGDGGGYVPPSNGNGGGDSGGYVPPSNGNGGGDNGGSVPPSNGGGNNGPGDRDNPSYDDF